MLGTALPVFLVHPQRNSYMIVKHVSRGTSYKLRQGGRRSSTPMCLLHVPSKISGHTRQHWKRALLADRLENRAPFVNSVVSAIEPEGVDNMLGRTHCSCLAISTSSCSPFAGTGGACSSTEIVSKHTTRREFLSVPPARACAGADDKVNAVHPTILSPS